MENDYRAYIGLRSEWDRNAASQFKLLTEEGLREGHSFLDIGCGSLCLGRLLLMYLSPGRYFGIEPNKWLIDEAIEKEIGDGIVVMKKPYFSYSDKFEIDIDITFDYIFADSIFTHCSPEKILQCLRAIKSHMKPYTVFLASFVQNPNHSGKMYAQKSDWDYKDDWVYPVMVCYEPEFMRSLISEAGLRGEVITRKHIYDKTWLSIWTP